MVWFVGTGGGGGYYLNSCLQYSSSRVKRFWPAKNPWQSILFRSHGCLHLVMPDFHIMFKKCKCTLRLSHIDWDQSMRWECQIFLGLYVTAFLSSEPDQKPLLIEDGQYYMYCNSDCVQYYKIPKCNSHIKINSDSQVSLSLCSQPLDWILDWKTIIWLKYMTI